MRSRQSGVRVLSAALVGMLIGFIGSMPVAGPIAVLVLGRGLQNRGSNALYLALGAGIAESVYAYLAFWGFSAFLIRYPWIERVAHFSASAVFIALGVHFYRKRNAPPAQAQTSHGGDKKSFFLGFTITALNPTLIATWTFTVSTVYSFGLVTFDAWNAVPFSLGALVGIVGWFAILITLMRRFRSNVRQRTIQRALHVMAIVLIVVGVGLGIVVARPYVARWLSS